MRRDYTNPSGALTDQMTNFLPHTPADRQALCDAIGITSPEALFEDIPESLRSQLTYTVLPQHGLSEQELMEELKTLADNNQANGFANFLGGGAYPRFIPMGVNTIANRSEFYTAYTPYQPEMSQGTLQVGFEFQTMISELTGMDVANAAVYDGGTAVSEAAFMAVRIKRRKKILIAKTVHPQHREILATYVEGLGEVTVETFDPAHLDQTLNTLDEKEAKTVACVILQQPNYFGSLETTQNIQDFCQQSGALFIVSADPVSLGLLKAPSDYGADIVVGDIQPLGNHLAYGGPYGGYMACKQKYMRQLPGRLVGRTTDRKGRPCYTLTLQTREQHIRRAKATSNICTSQTLNVLKATVYLALLGPQGLKHLAHLSVQRAHYLAERLVQLDGVELLHPKQPFFSEFALTLPVPVKPVLDSLNTHRILGGLPLADEYPEHPNSLLISVTELNTPEQLEQYIRFFSQALSLTRPDSQAGVSTSPALEAYSS